MKKCNTELMKELKEVRAAIAFAYQVERRACTTSYVNNEVAVSSNYDYSAMRLQIHQLQEKERSIKRLLAKSNVETIVEGFDMCIAEALVYLAQLSENKDYLNEMANRDVLSMNYSRYNGSVVYTQVRYDVSKAQEDLIETNRLIARLQIAIDRTNLTNMIEVD